MGDSVLDADRSPPGRKTAVERFIEAIGYPERAPSGARSYSLRIDGVEILAEETDGRLVLSYRLTADDGDLPALAGFASGRFLREEAALAVDPASPGAFLWQEAPAESDDHAFVRLFETFMDSCDWWRARLAAGPAERSEPAPEMMIRP